MLPVIKAKVIINDNICNLTREVLKYNGIVPNTVVSVFISEWGNQLNFKANNWLHPSQLKAYSNLTLFGNIKSPHFKVLSLGGK